MLSSTKPNANIQADAELPTKFGNFRIRAFLDPVSNKEHALLYIGENLESTPLVRIHSECLTGDAFGSLRCDCGPQLEAAMEEIQQNGCGAIVYLRQEGRNLGYLSFRPFQQVRKISNQETAFQTDNDLGWQLMWTQNF